MSSKSKSQLRTENSNNFPNNNSQFITPEKLRGFNNDIIDSLVVSSDTGSYVTTSSFDNGTRNLTFTKADGSTYVNNIPGGGTSDTGSLLTTASFDNSSRNLTFTKGDSSTFDVNIPGGDTGSLIETASVSDATITFTKADASQFSIEVNNVSASIQAEDLVITVKNQSGVTLPAGTAVKATGVTGENITIVSASADNPSLMPAIGVLNEQLTNNSTGECYIAGRLENINTSNLVAGAAVYVDINGGLTATKPSGSSLIQNIGIAAKINATEGELVIQGSGRSNDVPNIPQGQIWVGNSSGVATPTSTGSFAKIDENNTFTGNQTFNNITVNGTGSFAYIQSVTGSAKVIGDAFIILNNDTPTERYAGIKVYDSGSANNTSSFQYDGSTDDWFFEKDVLGTAEYGIALFGPEYTTKGTPTYNTNNTIPKGTGGHHLNDSNITDDGSTVSITGDLSVSGAYKGFDSGSFAILNQSNTFTNGLQLASGSSTYFKSVVDVPPFVAPSFDGYRTFVNAPNSAVAGTPYPVTQFSYANFPGYGNQYSSSLLFEATTANYATGSEFGINGKEIYWQMRSDGESAGNRARMRLRDIGTGASKFSLDANTIQVGVSSNTQTIDWGNSGTNFLIVGNQFDFETNVNYKSGFNITSDAPISSSTYVSASAFIGDGSQLSGVAGGIFIQTGSYYSTTNDLEVTGSFNVKGGIGGSNVDLTITSQTASVDLSLSNTFTLQLVNATDTHLDVSSFSGEGQSINVLVKQPAGAGESGSISFSPDFKFGQGYEFVPTPTNGAEDIISFTRFGNSLYGTYINNFS